MFLAKALKNQKGAMFGMDARLALMVFTVLTGTLSYFAYGKLQTIRQAALVKELTNIDYAIRSYQADMGTFTPFTLAKTADAEAREDISVLWSLKHIIPRLQHLWNGPYVDFSTPKHNLYGRYSLTYLTDEMTPCNAYENCYIFIQVSDVPQDVWLDVNKHFDEARGKNPEGDTSAHKIGTIRSPHMENPRTLMFKSVDRMGEN